MKFIDLLLIIIIIFVSCYILKYFSDASSAPNNKHENFDDYNKETHSGLVQKEAIDHLEDLINATNSKSKKCNANDTHHKNKINPIFIEAQFHDDYRDTITAFNNIAPRQKQIFNLGNIPVKLSTPPKKEIIKIVKDFISAVNKNVIDHVPDYFTSNSGWDEPLPQKREKFGWEKQMEALGLPSNLYPDPAKKNKIKLLDIDYIEKYETDDEIKYVVYMYIQKVNVKDQLLISVSFVVNKRNIDEERKFFDNDVSPKEEQIIIEDIFIVGYMTFNGTNKTNTKPNDFYNFKNLENQEMLDQKLILKELTKKYKQRAKDMNNFNIDLDIENSKFRSELPNLSGYNSYQTTQTIYDDILTERQFN